MSDRQADDAATIQAPIHLSRGPGEKLKIARVYYNGALLAQRPLMKDDGERFATKTNAGRKEHLMACNTNVRRRRRMQSSNRGV